ncbi:hypothetical protein SLS56_006646 [Neofusicoccum ribis]|uniref:beta-glucosidase n=1 Tax=Neofusicoccum ribis TaxID=45134 RepID=A0ABR3SRR4_9PEZI
MRLPVLLFAIAPAISRAQAGQPWLNSSLPVEERLKLFITQLNDTQKYAMVQGDTELEDNGTGVNACIGHITGNETLGIPSVCMADGPPGVANSLNNVTTFPAPVAVASSWNTTLQYVYAQALAQEHRAKGHNVVLAPTINIVRSPFWARAAEAFSEDPWLTSRMAVAGVTGLQSQGVLACPKHFAAYNQDTNRFGLDPEWEAVDVEVDKRVLHEVYFPAFKAAIQEGQAASIMCSYNKLNGYYACENEWLLNTTLRHDWGFDGFVVADWYFSTRSTVGSALAGLDISMPGGDLTESYGFPAYYGDLLVEAVQNGSVPASRIDDMVARIWRYMFKLGAVDDPVTGDAEAVARTQEHLDLAQTMAEDGAVLLKNDNKTLPITSSKYKRIAVFGVDATNKSQVSENHGGFVRDTTMVVQAPLDALKKRAEAEGIEVVYEEAYPGTDQFATIPASMFKNGGVNVTYWTTTDFSGAVNQTAFLPNITAATYPSELWQAWPQVFSCVYSAVFLPNTSGTHHFSLVGQGDALLYLNNQLVANMSHANFANTIQGTATLHAGTEVPLLLTYSMGASLSTGAYGITLGASPANRTRSAAAAALAASADLAIIFASDRLSEGADATGLALPGDQDAVVARLAAAAPAALVVLNTNSAVLMPWLGAVDAVMQAWYAGQQVGTALARLLFGDVAPSGKLPVSFPRSEEDAVRIEGGRRVGYGEGLYVGYRAYEKSGVEPLFAFGHGLTYSEFALGGMGLGVVEEEGSRAVVVAAALSNEGGVDARQVVQLYVSFPDEAGEPVKQLKGFVKEFVGAGRSVNVSLSVGEDDLRIWDETTAGWRFVAGTYTFYLGFSATDLWLENSLRL